MSKPYSLSRLVAARVLHRIAVESAWASKTLDVEIDEVALDARDAALATTITYGTLRVLPSIDAAIDAVLTRKGALDPFTRASLRTAAYQLRHLRTPPHAVVSDTVAMIKDRRGLTLSRFANAILRKLAEQRPEEPKEPSEVELPDWLRKEITASLGPTRAHEFLSARVLPPPLSLRARRSREDLIAALREARPAADVRAAALSPAGVYASRVGDLRALSLYHEGDFALQDEGSQLVAFLADVSKDMRVADVCAGRGGKTAILAEQLAGTGKLVAVDLYEAKLQRIAEELDRLNVSRTNFEIRAVDLSVGTGGLSGEFDRVLVDAPCTGLGTIHRRPEVLLRVVQKDPERMAKLQCSIVRNALGLLAPAGVLTYAVCSPMRAEAEGVARTIETEFPELERLPTGWKGVPSDPDGILRIGPYGIANECGPDAYQVVRWRRRT